MTNIHIGARFDDPICNAARNGYDRDCQGPITYDGYFRVDLCTRHAIMAAEDEAIAEGY